MVPVHTPPLREIRGDIPLIAHHFLSLVCSELGVDQKRLTENAIQLLVSRKWQGNARELLNQIKRAVVFSKNDFLSSADFGNEASFISAIENDPDKIYKLDYKEARKKVLATFSEEYIKDLLRQTDGNVSLAARTSGIERQYLQQLIRKNRITSSEFRGKE